MSSVPSRASEPIIQLSIINFHDKSIPVPDCIIPHHNLEQHFGIFRLKIRDTFKVQNQNQKQKPTIVLEDVILDAENCEIYKCETNKYENSLYVGHLYSNQEIVYQIQSPNPKRAQIAIYGRAIHQTNDIVFQGHAIPVPNMIKPLKTSCDLTNYLFKQRAQELLFENKHNLFPTQELKEYTHTLSEYIKTNDLLENPFFKSICDNIRSIYKDQKKSKSNYKDQSFFQMGVIESSPPTFNLNGQL